MKQAIRCTVANRRTMAFLQEFLADCKDNGFIIRLVAKHRVAGLVVFP